MNGAARTPAAPSFKVERRPRPELWRVVMAFSLMFHRSAHCLDLPAIGGVVDLAGLGAERGLHAPVDVQAVEFLQEAARGGGRA